MSVHRSISLWGVWYLQWKSTPKMKFFDWRLWISEDFLKTLKVKKLVWPWRLGIHLRNMKREDFCFRSFIFSFLSHRKHRTVKGGRSNTKETNFQVMLISKSYTYPILRVKPLEIPYQFSQFLQWQKQRSSGLWGICSDWGVRNSPVQISYTVRNMIALRILLLKIPTVAVLCASCPKISIHLTVISLKGIYVLSCRAAP